MFTLTFISLSFDNIVFYVNKEDYKKLEDDFVV